MKDFGVDFAIGRACGSDEPEELSLKANLAQMTDEELVEYLACLKRLWKARRGLEKPVHKQTTQTYFA